MSAAPAASEAERPVAVAIRNVDKWFGNFQALRQIDLDVHKGEKIVICGPSGSGKSTLIRCINRLEKHDSGRIVVNGIEVSDSARAILDVRREVGMVFQQFNLFPHLTFCWCGRPPTASSVPE
jgi:general L-amino acid transport system ATP-binding protein